jgi:hypothetical protein
MGDEVLAGAPLLSGVALAGKGEGALELLAVDRLDLVGLVLLDDGEEVAKERALVGGQLARDRVRTGRARAPGGLADAGVAATLALAQGPAVAGCLALLRARYACALLRRNRMASWCLARQSA